MNNKAMLEHFVGLHILICSLYIVMKNHDDIFTFSLIED